MKVKKGDKVQMSDTWCESIQADLDIASLKGIVITAKPLGHSNQYCKVKWSNGRITGVLSSNMKKLNNPVTCYDKKPCDNLTRDCNKCNHMAAQRFN